MEDAAAPEAPEGLPPAEVPEHDRVVLELKAVYDVAVQHLDSTPQVKEAIWADIVRRHEEPHRHYHTLQHLHAMIQWLKRQYKKPMPLATVLSVLFHDCVYDPRASDNEDQSFKVAKEALAALGVENHVRNQVQVNILATIGHAPRMNAPPDELLFLDADLSILASSEQEYDAYVQAIRQEYSHLADPVFKTGRAGVLGKLLSRPQVYFSAQARKADMESKARANMQRELDKLKRDVPGTTP